MPKVTHLICMTDGHMVSSADFPSHVKLLSFNEVEMSGALPDNSKCLSELELRLNFDMSLGQA